MTGSIIRCRLENLRVQIDAEAGVPEFEESL